MPAHAALRAACWRMRIHRMRRHARLCMSRICAPPPLWHSPAGKKCVPCEEAKDALEYTGLSMTIDQAEAEQLLASVEGWQLRPDAKQRPRIRKRMRTKNFAKVP